MARRPDRITGETRCGCGDYAGQHDVERAAPRERTYGDDDVEYGECRAMGGCSAEDGDPCTDFHLPEPVVAVVDVQLVNEASTGWPGEGLKEPVTVTYTHDVHDPEIDLSACTRRIGCPSPLHRVDCRALFEARIEDDPAEVVHALPPHGSANVPCCDRSPFDLPVTDRITVDGVVTCGGADPDDPDEDGPLNDDWIAPAYERQAELRDAGLLDEGP